MQNELHIAITNLVYCFRHVNMKYNIKLSDGQTDRQTDRLVHLSNLLNNINCITNTMRGDKRGRGGGGVLPDSVEAQHF